MQPLDYLLAAKRQPNLVTSRVGTCLISDAMTLFREIFLLTSSSEFV